MAAWDSHEVTIKKRKYRYACVNQIDGVYTYNVYKKVLWWWKSVYAFETGDPKKGEQACIKYLEKILIKQQ